MLARCSGRARSSVPSRDLTITIGQVAVAISVGPASPGTLIRAGAEDDAPLRLAREAGAREAIEAPAPGDLGVGARRDPLDLDGADDDVGGKIGLDLHAGGVGARRDRLHLGDDRVAERCVRGVTEARNDTESRLRASRRGRDDRDHRHDDDELPHCPARLSISRASAQPRNAARIASGSELVSTTGSSPSR